MIDDKPIVTAAEAARLAGVHARYIINAILRGALKGEKVGPIWMIEEASLQQYIEQRKAEKARRPGGPRGGS